MKPTYDQLLDLVQYLAIRADHENLPLRDDSRAAVDYALENAPRNSFDSNESDE